MKMIYLDLFIFSLSLLFLYAIWEFAWVPAIKCYYKSKLYKLSVETKNYFAISTASEHNHAVISDNLLRVLNAYSRNISKVSFSSFFAFKRVLKKNPDLANYHKELAAEFEGQFNTQDKELRRFIGKVRSEASKSLTCFMFYRNPFYVALLVILLIPLMPLSVLYFTARAMDILAKLELGKIFDFKRIERFICSRANC